MTASAIASSSPSAAQRRQTEPSGADPRLGSVLGGRFTLIERLGSGSMGLVYRAKQAPMDRDVAVKILRAERAIDDEARARFLREAHALALLSSPNTVTVLDFGPAEGGEFFIAMELLEGESLQARLARVGRFDVDHALDTVRQALRSLAEAHAKGIIHRDLKPANLFFARAGSGDSHEEILKVLDFGVAKLLEVPSGDVNLAQTQAGTVVGTPCYMSPEQAQGKPLDARSDLYAMGVILYELLTGRPPFMDETNMLVMARHVKTSPPAMADVARTAHVPVEIEEAVLCALAKDPGKRPQSAEAMITQLTQALDRARTAVSGVRPAVKLRWRSALSAALHAPSPRRPHGSSRNDATVKTRAVTRRRAFPSHVAVAGAALAIAFAAFVHTAWVHARGAARDHVATDARKDSTPTVHAASVEVRHASE